MTRDDILAFILKEEGGLVNNPADPGGLTNHGVTQRYYDDRKAKGTVPAGYPDSVADLTADQAAQLYVTDQWAFIHGDALDPSLALLALDCAVNQGAPEAVILLQLAANVTHDGIMGPGTLAAIHARDPRVMLKEFAARRAVRYAAGNDTFELGWMRRLFDAYTMALTNLS